VIVRVSTVGQFRLPDEDVARLNDLDNQAVAAVEAGDEARFADLFGQMVALVRADGEELASDEIVQSDVILPPPDTSFAEAAADFSGDGLIPD
jgi:predicted transcriptional regulator